MKQVFLSILFLQLFTCFLFSQTATQESIFAAQNNSLAYSEPTAKWILESFGSYDQGAEDQSLRDQNAKHFKNSDGTYTALIAAGNFHYWEDNSWKTIFHTIEPRPGIGFQNLTNSHKTYFPQYSNGSVRTILSTGEVIKDLKGMRMYFLTNGVEENAMSIQSKPGSVNFNELTYSDVYGNGIDLKLTQHTTKRKMDYLIDDIGSLGMIPIGAEYLVFEEKVELPNGWTYFLEQNKIFIKNANGEIKLIYEKPMFKDAPQLDLEGHNHSDEAEGTYSVSQSGNVITIQTKVQLSWLTDPERAFPVVIDPTVNLYPNNANWWTGHYDAYHNSTDVSADAPLYSSSSYYDDFNDNIYVGRHSTYYPEYGWVKFNISSLPNSCVNSASLNYRVYDNYSSSSDCLVNVRLRHLTNDPVVTTGNTLLNDIRDGNIYAVGDMRCFTTGSGLVTAPLTSNIGDIESSMPSGIFSMGFHTFQGGPHTSCYTGIYGYSSSSRPYLAVNYTPYYQVTFSNPTPTTFCAGQTQNISVTVTNTGCRPWTSGGSTPDNVNFSWWGSWQNGGLADGYDNNPRQYPFSGLAPGASQVVTFSVTVPSTPGSYSIQTDLVRELECWFRGNSAPSCGPGNVDYIIPITVNPVATVNAGSDITISCGNNTSLNGSAAMTAIYYLTTSGGIYHSEKWVNITTGANGTGTVVWAQGNGTIGNSSGLLTNQAINLSSYLGQTLYLNAYDSYDDGWDGTKYNLVYNGATIINNGNVSPSDGNNNDASNGWDGTANEIERSESFVVVSPGISWSGGPIVSGGNSLTPTVNPTTTTTYTLTSTLNGCSSTDQVTVNITPASNPPTSVSATHPLHPEYCHGNTINLTSVGGTPAGGNVVDVWYENSCNTTVEETWATTPVGRPGWWIGSTTVNSANGILNVTSTGVDPMIYMGNLSIDPNVFRYVQVRYRYVSGPTNPGMQVFFDNGLPLNESRSQRGTMIMDGAWHYLNLDMSVNYSGANSGWIGGPTVTGLRFDFCEATGMVMEFDFFLVSEDRMVGDQTNLVIDPSSPYYPSSSTQYFTRKIDDCGATTCASTNANLPPMGTTLAFDGEDATCYIFANETIKYYHSSGRYIATVTSEGNELGSTIATAYVEPGYLIVPACDMPSLDIAVMQRHWVITPTADGSATVRLPYYLSELTDLGAGSLVSSSPYDLIVAPNNSDVLLSKYSGGTFPSVVNVNDDPYDNCAVGGTTLHTNVGIGATTPVPNINSMYSDFTIPGFSEFWLHGQSNNSPLPIELISFSSVCNDLNEEVHLTWSTASENNTSHFEVQRSLDGAIWDSRATIPAAGNSNVVQNYNWVDNDARGYDMLYYRLLQVDNDGNNQIFGPTSAKCDGLNQELELFPNPAGSAVTIRYQGDFDALDSWIVVSDINSKELIRTPFEESVLNLDLKNLDPGVYLVRLINGKDQSQFVRLVKQ